MDKKEALTILIQLVILSLTLTVLAPMAGKGGGSLSGGKLPRWSAEGKAEKLSLRQVRILHLSAAQVTQIEQINLAYGQQVDYLEASRPVPGLGTRMLKMNALRQQRDARYHQVFNPDQFKQWNDLEFRHREKLKAYRRKRMEKILAVDQLKVLYPSNAPGYFP